MIKKIAFLAILTILCGYLLADNSGMALLNMPTSAKSAATMGVFAAEANNATNLFENSLGIRSQNTNINFTNNFWFADVNQSVLTIGTPTKWGHFATGLNFVYAPGFEVRSKPSDEPEGEIEAHFMTAALGFTREVLSRVYFGINAKYLYQSLYTETASGFAVDFSAMWRMPSNMNITFAMQNLGEMSKLDQEATKLPTTMKIGIVRPELLSGSGPMNGSLGIYFDQNLQAQRTEIKVGVQIDIYKKLFLRGGYSLKQEYNNSSFGIGLKIKKLKFDLAMMMIGEIPDYPYLFTFSYDL